MKDLTKRGGARQQSDFVSDFSAVDGGPTRSDEHDGLGSFTAYSAMDNRLFDGDFVDEANNTVPYS